MNKLREEESRKVWERILRPSCFGAYLSKSLEERDKCVLTCEYYEECLSLTMKKVLEKWERENSRLSSKIEEIKNKKKKIIS